MLLGSSVPDMVTSATTTTMNAREGMSQAGPLCRDLFLDTFLREQVQEPGEVPGKTDLIEPVNLESCLDGDSNPDDNVALRLPSSGRVGTERKAALHCHAARDGCAQLSFPLQPDRCEGCVLKRYGWFR